MHICPFIEQYTAKLNTPPTRDSRENRLSFFYADRQKGATTYDETERENPRGIDRAERGILLERKFKKG